MPGSTGPMRVKQSARHGSLDECGDPALVAVAAVAVRKDALAAVLVGLVPDAVPSEVTESEREIEREGKLPLLLEPPGLVPRGWE